MYSGDSEGIWNHVIIENLDFYTSFAFEEVCLQYLRRKNRRNELQFYFTQIGRWWNKTDELDIMAMDNRKKIYRWRVQI